MNLSFVGEASKQFSTVITSDNKENTEYYSISSLQNTLNEQGRSNVSKQSLIDEQKLKKVMKMQRQLQVKDMKISELTNNIFKLKAELKNFSNDKQLLATQYQEQNEKLLKLQNELLLRDKKQKINQQRLILSSKQSTERLKEQLNRLQNENSNLSSNYGALSKQFKITVRRIKESSQEIRKQLEGKLLVKQMQQKKVEQILKQKKEELQSVLQQKDLQFSDLQTENARLKQQIIKIQQEYTKSTDQYDYKIASLSEQVLMHQKTIKDAKTAMQVQKQLIIQQIIMFADSLQLQSSQKNVKLMLQQYKQQIQNKIQQRNSQIQSLQNRLKSQKLEQNELKSKLSLLEEQNKFIKVNQSQNQDFASMIKSHLQNTISKYQKSAAEKDKQANNNKDTLSQHAAAQNNNIAKKNQCKDENFMSLTDCKAKVDEYLRKKQIAPRPTITQDPFPFPKPLFKEFERSNSYNHIHRKSMSSLQIPANKISCAKSSKNLLTDEICKKKQALVYLMHKSSKIQTSNTKVATKSNRFECLQVRAQKRRSSSMINLVADKCRQKLD